MEVFKHLVFTGKVISLEQASLLPLNNLLEIRGPFVICFSFQMSLKTWLHSHVNKVMIRHVDCPTGVLLSYEANKVNLD